MNKPIQKVYFATNPRDSQYKWITRGKHEHYIMLHKSAISKSSLVNHSFYDCMVFEEIVDEDTLKWANHVIDTNTMISQEAFKLKETQSKGRVIREPNTNVEYINILDLAKSKNNSKKEDLPDFPKKGDIVVAVNKVTNTSYWLFELGDKITEVTLNPLQIKHKISKGIKITTNSNNTGTYSVVTNFDSDVFCLTSDIVRFANENEKTWFYESINNKFTKREKPSENTNSIDNSIIQFGSIKKEQIKKENKTNLEINQIKIYEY